MRYRTSLFIFIIIISFFAGYLMKTPYLLSKETDKKAEISPHTEALELVFTTQQDIIKKFENPSSWWFDVKQREWNVKRPFYPGGMDSTHLFIVTYKIEGKEIISWTVDTRNKTISENKK